MLIGSQYSDNKIYRGIKHYDSLPLFSEDLHEYSDTIYMKNAYLMNNIMGYGLLNTPALSISDYGVRLQEPAVILIDGDISLIQTDDDKVLMSRQVMEFGPGDHVIAIMGWYQELNAQSTLRNYGGVKNSIIENDIINNDLNIQSSTRYQFRWTALNLSKSHWEGESTNLYLSPMDATGALIPDSGNMHLQFHKRVGDVFIASKPDIMDYACSDIYLIPIIKFTSEKSSIVNMSPWLPIRPKGTSGFIKSETEPLGEYIDGTTWYNPTTREFKTYVAGSGFVDSASTMGFLQYQSVYTIQSDSISPTIPINISNLAEGDILRVVYEGLVLVEGENYSINYTRNNIQLIDFSVLAGEKITFTVTKIVEANDITNITTLFTSHMESTASSTIEAHVKLSDTADASLDSTEGVAATPKSVYESSLIVDQTNNTKYKFGVEDGLLYIEEV